MDGTPINPSKSSSSTSKLFLLPNQKFKTTFPIDYQKELAHFRASISNEEKNFLDKFLCLNSFNANQALTSKKFFDPEKDLQQIAIAESLFGKSSIKKWDTLEKKGSLLLKDLGSIRFSQPQYSYSNPIETDFPCESIDIFLFFYAACQSAYLRHGLHLPYQQQSLVLHRQALKAEPELLAHLTEHLFNLLEPIWLLLEQKILFEKEVNLDEMPLKLFGNKEYGHIAVIYNKTHASYRPYKTESFLEELNSKFSTQTMIRDEFFNFDLNNSIPCLPGLRRFCYNNDTRRKELLGFLNEIFFIEEEAKTPDMKSFLRTKKTKFECQKFNHTLNLAFSNDPIHAYVSTNRERIFGFLDDFEAPIDPLFEIKKHHRPFLAKKSALGFKDFHTAKIACFFYSIMESCELSRIDPQTYLINACSRLANKQPFVTPRDLAMAYQDM